MVLHCIHRVIRMRQRQYTDSASVRPSYIGRISNTVILGTRLTTNIFLLFFLPNCPTSWYQDTHSSTGQNKGPKTVYEHLELYLSQRVFTRDTCCDKDNPFSIFRARNCNICLIPTVAFFCLLDLKNL
jgi:hypothetical protein